MTVSGNRRGFALVTVLLLMAVGTALMVAAMNGSLSDAATARGGTLQRRALVGAESEAWATFRSLNVAVLRAAPVGRISVASRTVDDMTVIATVDKTDNSNVWIVATATIRWSATVARHRVGLSALIPGDTADLALRLVPERAWAELF
ncbi:MAG: pilus assembly PilX N-terminal domain-containing protein [Gemmatimonadales bacterium]